MHLKVINVWQKYSCCSIVQLLPSFIHRQSGSEHMSGPWKEGDSLMKRLGILVVLLKGITLGLWSHLKCSRQNITILSWVSNDNKLLVFSISALYASLSSTIDYHGHLSLTAAGDKAYCAVPKNIPTFCWEHIYWDFLGVVEGVCKTKKFKAVWCFIGISRGGGRGVLRMKSLQWGRYGQYFLELHILFFFRDQRMLKPCPHWSHLGVFYNLNFLSSNPNLFIWESL